jgi:hypothetical protein
MRSQEPKHPKVCHICANWRAIADAAVLATATLRDLGDTPLSSCRA